jgi:hypothetical protein
MMYTCPSDFGCLDFEGTPQTHISQASYERSVKDEQGHSPTMAGDLEDSGARLTRRQWTILDGVSNPDWTPTYETVVVDDEPVEHQIVKCPSCGSTVKVG